MTNTNTYLVLLRGINVGGNNIIKMADLREALLSDGFSQVTTYIQSGNIILSSSHHNLIDVKNAVASCLASHFEMEVSIAIVPAKSWIEAISGAPSWWGSNENWKHNIFVLPNPSELDDVMHEIGAVNNDVERIAAGEGVVYQSMSKDHYGKTRISKLPSKPVYKKITIRNYNTAIKLSTLLEQ